MNRRDGYITDVGYPAFFYKEMQPLWLSTVTTMLGYSAPSTSEAFSHCELGCGVGINLLVAAASHPQAQFVGVDFNEQHIQVARAAAQASGLNNISFISSDFAEFRKKNSDTFDFMTSHGVWSWVAPQHQSHLLECVVSSLKPDGIFYLHYMCHPGSTDLIVAQNLLNQVAHHGQGSSAQRVKEGLRLLLQLAESGAFVDQPRVVEKLRHLSQKDPHHLAHEFLTEHWQPQHAAKLHHQFSDVGLTYLGSADAFNNLDTEISIPGRLQSIVNKFENSDASETLRDIARHSYQRMDIFQRTPRQLTAQAHVNAIHNMAFTLVPGAPAHGPVSFTTAIGQIEGPSELATPILTMLQKGSATVAELVQSPVFQHQPELLMPSLQLMMVAGMVHPTQSSAQHAIKGCDGLATWFQQNGIALQLFAAGATAKITV